MLLLLIALLGLPITGCRSLVPPGWGAGEEDRAREIPLRIERPEAPPEYDVLVGELAEREGGIAEARAAFERAAAKDPGSAFIHHRLARLSWQLDDVERAVEEAELALELAPESVEIRLFLGRLYRLRRDFEGLDRVLRDAEGEPLDADSAYTLFQVALDRGELAEAEALARELIASEPDQLRGALALATVQERRGELDAAEATVRGALESFPDHFLLYMRLAQIERERENRAGEIAVYQEVLDSHPLHYGILQRLRQAQIEGNNLEA
ncbi:MAG: tetratricopeptide repeat protein, partial [bacterium]